MIANYDLAFTLVVVLPLVLMVVALVSAVRHRELRGLLQVAWFALIVLAPVVGPILWFVAGRRNGATHQ
ncbi:PLD nuclease N-terminal domain-containing protein [Ruania suaedae]|uniref:PLDc N-terminal domain-containing protein n=1 Tax=Ruania suaedae TaxID=2897774 RepID=UPI001E550920|nr:PLD nuclease N-terminal domain-containing protein [Ruania suaedae]UFU02004.1 PLD nuclease N-terminal domain-containing protein [Ruania suaedae]